MRTFVIADAHGHPEVIRAALDHGCFEPGRDRFVFGGDFLDRGSDAQGCLDLIERFATEVIIGNHDLAVLLGRFIWPQEIDSPRFRPLLVERVLHRDPPEAWKAVTAVDGVLVSHAGVSARYERAFRETCNGEPTLFAERMNEDFREAVRRQLDDPVDDPGAGMAGPADWEADPAYDWDRDATARAILGDYGPFWFRPPPFTHARPLGGVVQIAGHSPAVPELAKEGFYMIDPVVWVAEAGEPLRFRYAVVEDGAVAVHEGDVPILAGGEHLA